MGSTSGQGTEDVFRDDAIVEASDRLVSTAVGEDEILLDTDDGIYYEANSVGRRILELIRDGARVETIRETIATEFDVDEETCDGDVKSFLADLHEAGLVSVDRSA